MSNPSHPESRPVSHQYELAVLGEECGEAIQIVGKTLRFGYESYNPDDKARETNLDLLHKELGDILAAIDFACDRGLLDRDKLGMRQINKRRHLHQVAPPNTYVPVQQRPMVMQSTPTGDQLAIQALVSGPDSSPRPQSEPSPLPSRGQQIAAVVGVLLLLICLGYAALTWMGSPEEDRLAALKSYDECLVANKGNEASCNAKAKAAGEAELPTTAATPAEPKAPAKSRNDEIADQIINGTR